MGCFNFLAILNKVSTHINMQISVWRLVSIYLGYLTRSRIADSCNNYNIYIFRNCRLVSKVCSQFTISTAIMSFHFSTFSPTFTVVCLDYSHPNVYKVGPDCSLDFHFSTNIQLCSFHILFYYFIVIINNIIYLFQCTA